MHTFNVPPPREHNAHSLASTRTLPRRAPPPHPRLPLARAYPRPRNPSDHLLSPRCIFYTSPNPQPAQHQQHHCDPAQTLRNHSQHTTHPLPPPISHSLPASAKISAEKPQTHPRSLASAHSRGPATPYSYSPPHCAHIHYSRALSAPQLRHTFAPTPHTTRILPHFALRTQCAHPNTIFPTAHPRTAPHSHRPKTQSAPCRHLRRPAAARDPSENVGNCDADAMRPSAASADKNSGSQGRGQGRASGWPRWDPLPLSQRCVGAGKRPAGMA